MYLYCVNISTSRLSIVDWYNQSSRGTLFRDLRWHWKWLSWVPLIKFFRTICPGHPENRNWFPRYPTWQANLYPQVHHVALSRPAGVGTWTGTPYQWGKCKFYFSIGMSIQNVVVLSCSIISEGENDPCDVRRTAEICHKVSITPNQSGVPTRLFTYFCRVLKINAASTSPVYISRNSALLLSSDLWYLSLSFFGIRNEKYHEYTVRILQIR